MMSMKRPSQCRVCRKMFRSKDGLSRHVESVHFAAKTNQAAAARCEVTTKASLSVDGVIMIDDDDDVPSVSCPGPKSDPGNSGQQPDLKASDVNSDEDSSTSREFDKSLKVATVDSQQESIVSSETRIEDDSLRNAENPFSSETETVKPPLVEVTTPDHKVGEVPETIFMDTDIVVENDANVGEGVTLTIGTTEGIETQPKQKPEFVFVDISEILGRKIDVEDKVEKDSAFSDTSGSVSAGSTSYSSSNEDSIASGLSDRSSPSSAVLPNVTLDICSSLPDDGDDVILVDDDNDDDVAVVDIVKEGKRGTSRSSTGAFTRQGKFRQVMLDRNKANECDVCYKKLKSPETLKKHKRLHDRFLFRCDKCSKVLATKESLQSHVKNVHERKLPSSCRFCGETFRAKVYLDQHVQLDHPNERAAVIVLD